MIYILNKLQQTVGVAVNGSPNSLPYFNDIHYETLEGVSTYEFVVPADREESNVLEVNGYVIIRDMDGHLILFQIKEIMENYENNVPVKRMFCENAAISELLGDVHRPINLPSSSLSATVETVMQSSQGWEVGEIELFESRDFVVEEYTTVLEVINKIAEEYGCEYYFTVTLNGTQISKKMVHFVDERGNDTGVRFDYGHHLRNISRTEDSTQVITAVVPVGKGDADGVRLTIDGLAAFDDGEFYKPESADWIGSHDALQQWSKDGKHIFGVMIVDTAETVKALKSLAISHLKYRGQPNLVYATTIIDVERMTGYESRKIRLGDRIVIKDNSFTPSILVSARVKEIKRSYSNSFEFNDDIKLGNYQTLSNKIPAEIRKMQNFISLNEDKWNAVQLNISSTGGDIFKNGVGSTVLTANMYKGGQKIDVDGTEFTYTWVKYDKTGTIVTNWNRTGKSISLTDADIDEKATFSVEVEYA